MKRKIDLRRSISMTNFVKQELFLALSLKQPNNLRWNEVANSLGIRCRR